MDVPPVGSAPLAADPRGRLSRSTGSAWVVGTIGDRGCRTNDTPVARNCRPDADGCRLLTQAVQAFGLSARGYARVLKVARTIAELGGSDRVRTDDVAEALQYRLAQ